MATVIRVNPAASPLRNVSFTGLASVAVGDRVPVRIELVNDARSGAAGYTPALFLGVRGTPLASVASWSASTVSGVAGWDGILRCDTSELADYVGLNASMTVMCQIVITKNDTSELVTEAQNQVTVFSTVAPDGVYIPTPDTPTYSDLIALESTAVSAAAEASIDASLAASSAFAADSSADLADGYADAALSSAVAADGSADAALSSAVVADLEASIAVSAASAAVAVVPSINAQLALRVVKDASGNTEALNSLLFDTTPTAVPHAEGTVHWNTEDHTLELDTDQAGVMIQVGQENVVRVRNSTGSTLLNGKVVYINGSTGQRPTVALADNTVSASATKTIGVMTADLANNSDGYATTQGLVRDLNTSAFSDGATVYLGTAGNLTMTQPTAPNEIIRVGHVVKAHVTQGVLLVGVQHHQDAAEVPLASIVGIGATDVQAAVSELLSDITAETSARISGDASVSTALSTAISQRISADASLAAAQSVETSRATSVEATKLPLSGGTLTGTLNGTAITTSGAAVVGTTLTVNGFSYLNADARIGDGMSQSRLYQSGSAAHFKHYYIQSAGTNRWAWMCNPDGGGSNAGADLFGVAYNDAGSSIGNWLEVTRATRAVLFPGALTVSGLCALQGATTVGTNTTAAELAINGPTNANKILRYRRAGVSAWTFYSDSTNDNFVVNRHGDDGLVLSQWINASRATGATNTYGDWTFTAALTVSGLATLNGGLTASTITNYAADVTVASLLALTPAQSAAKRKATVTGAYRMDGTIGRVDAFWDGDASAGTWRISGSSIVVTNVRKDWLTSLRTSQHVQEDTQGKVRCKPCLTRGLAASAWATVSGSGAFAANACTGNNQDVAIYVTGNTATGACRRTGDLDTVNTTVVDANYYSARLSTGSALSAVGESYYAYGGFVHPTALTSPVAGASACFLYDPQDTLALGVTNGNWWAMTRTTGGLVSLVDTGVAFVVGFTPPHMEIVQTPSSVSFYSGGTLVATITTNLPTGVLGISEGIIKTSGSLIQQFNARSRYMASLSA